MPTLIVFSLALITLIVSSRFAIKSLTALTSALGISEFAIAFILLAVATSTPELFVSISSSLADAGSLVIATALGSNVINMTLIIGLAAFLSAGISTDGLYIRRDVLLGGVITMLPIIFLFDGEISRLDGAILLLFFAVYVYQLMPRSSFSNRQSSLSLATAAGHSLVVAILIAVVIVSAHVVVSTAVDITRLTGIPEFMIGIFILAFGTSLPELVTTVGAALMRKPNLALGTILGSNIADSALIIGLASLIRPLQVDLTASIAVAALSVIVSLAFLTWFALSKKRLSTYEGAFLVLLFLVFGVVIATTSLDFHV